MHNKFQFSYKLYVRSIKKSKAKHVRINTGNKCKFKIHSPINKLNQSFV